MSVVESATITKTSFNAILLSSRASEISWIAVLRSIFLCDHLRRMEREKKNSRFDDEEEEKEEGEERNEEEAENISADMYFFKTLF